MTTRSSLLAACLLFSSAIQAAAQTNATLEHSIAAPPVGAQTGGALGYSVAVSPSYTVVGAPFDDLLATDSGAVKVFDSATNALVFVLLNPDPAATDNFGYSVAISGTRVVVGAYLDDTGAPDAGSAYVYDLSGPTPTTPIAILNNPDPADGDFFGAAVAISGTRVVVGAYSDNTGAANAGRAYVYDLNSASPDGASIYVEQSRRGTG